MINIENNIDKEVKITEQEFAKQFRFIELLCLKSLKYLEAKNWDESQNSLSIKLAEIERENLISNIKDILSNLKVFEKNLSFSKKDIYNKLINYIDLMSYISQRVALLFISFHKFSPSNNINMLPQRSMTQSIVPINKRRINGIIFETLNRDQKKTTEYETNDETTYGRMSFNSNFQDLYESLRDIYDLPYSSEIGIVNSGMSAEVVANLLVQDYIGKKANLLLFEEKQRYFEHNWAEQSLNTAQFSLKNRPNTEVSIYSENHLEKIKEYLSLDKKNFVLLKTEIIFNEKNFGKPLLLKNELLQTLNKLSQNEQARLIFIIDITLYPKINISDLYKLLPNNSLIITESSLNKFHQAGFDLGGMGVLTMKKPDGYTTDLDYFMYFSGMTPAPQVLINAQLLISQEILDIRIKIISENTKLMSEIFDLNGIRHEKIKVDDRFTNEMDLGGLISIPKLGMKKIQKLIKNLSDLGIQIDNRASFGHNFTSLEDIHFQDWSRISVGIENKATIEIIANQIVNLIKEN